MTFTYNVVCVIFLEFLDIGVDQRLVVPALYTELSFARKSSSGEKNEFHHGNDTVVLNNPRNGFRFANLLSDRLRGIKEINLAIFFGFSTDILYGRC